MNLVAHVERVICVEYKCVGKLDLDLYISRTSA